MKKVSFVIALNFKVGHVTWQREFPELELAGEQSLLALGGAEHKYILEAEVEDGIMVVELDSLGKSRWQKKFLNSRETLKSLLVRSKGQHIVYAQVEKRGCHIFAHEANIQRPLLKHTFLPYVYPSSAAETSDGGIVLAGQYTTNHTNIGKDCVVRVNPDGQISWIKFVVPSREGHRVAEAVLDRRYLVYGATARDDKDLAFVMNLYADGSEAWHATFSSLVLPVAYKGIVDLLELNAREYLMVGHGLRKIAKYTAPPFSEQLRCRDLEECQYCRPATFWNYTECVECPNECSMCVSSEFCLTCVDLSSPPRNGKCESKLNLTRPLPSEPIISPVCDCGSPLIPFECRSACSPKYCDLGFHSVFPKNLSGRKACMCPENTFDNGTHCFLVLRNGCPGLCTACVNESGTANCLECQREIGVTTSRVHAYFVQCACISPNYTYNGSNCRLSTFAAQNRTATSAGTDGNSRKINTYVISGIVLTALLAVGIAWMVNRRRTRDNAAARSDVTAATQDKVSTQLTY